MTITTQDAADTQPDAQRPYSRRSGLLIAGGFSLFCWALLGTVIWMALR